MSPKGNVPTLVLADGTVLNEGAAVLQYIADQAPEAGLAAPYGTTERYQLFNVLNYLASDIHSGCFAPLFYAPSAEAREPLYPKLAAKLKYVTETLLQEGKKDYVVGSTFSVADAYLYIILTWSPYVGVDLTPFPALVAYKERIGALDFVQGAHAAMAAASPKA